MHHHSVEEGIADLAILDLLTAPTLPSAKHSKHGLQRRDSDLDPLLLAAAASCGPHVTRNHYAHDFFPAVIDPRAEGAWDWTNWKPDDAQSKAERKPRLKYVSRQAPRRQRLREAGILEDEKENNIKEERTVREPLRDANVSSSPTNHYATPSLVSEAQPQSVASSINHSSTSVAPRLQSSSSGVEVKCMARTRVPTPHGPVFLHLYHNNRDDKEHLAIVIDPAQLTDSSSPMSCPPIRSRSLDAVWSETETEVDRITRGAYVGRLSPTSQKPSSPSGAQATLTTDAIPSPLIRIHSECFTGETIGSMRCDCGEQLDEAIRRISQPIHIPSPSPGVPHTDIPGRGAVIYLRQEGRGIGLLSKLRAYNLQDLGHDTVTANLMLGHKADERGYEIAAAILRDLGLGSGPSEGVRILTNNPDKMQALEKEGIRIVERVPMIPRTWQQQRNTDRDATEFAVDTARIVSPEDEVMDGVTMIGSRAVHGEDLDKYLRTKVLRMGHLLPLVEEQP